MQDNLRGNLSFGPEIVWGIGSQNGLLHGAATRDAPAKIRLVEERTRDIEVGVLVYLIDTGEYSVGTEWTERRTCEASLTVR